MADDKVGFELVSPERLLLSESVEMVVVPGSEGDFGVLPRHTPMISTVRPGFSLPPGRTIASHTATSSDANQPCVARCT